MSCPRSSCAAAAVGDVLCVVGGCDDSWTELQSAEELRLEVEPRCGGRGGSGFEDKRGIHDIEAPMEEVPAEAANAEAAAPPVEEAKPAESAEGPAKAEAPSEETGDLALLSVFEAQASATQAEMEQVAGGVITAGTGLKAVRAKRAVKEQELQEAMDSRSLHILVHAIAMAEDVAEKGLLERAQRLAAELEQSHQTAHDQAVHDAKSFLKEEEVSKEVVTSKGIALSSRKVLIEPGDIICDLLDKSNFLGKGSFGEVYSATFKKMPDSPVCVKIFSRDLLLEADQLQKAVKAAEKELRLMSTITHPNIIQAYGVCEKDDLLMLVMEKADLGCLQQCLQKQLLLFSARVSVALDTAFGMSYLHAVNIVHRDLKSDNIMLVPGSNPDEIFAKISDFGLATSARSSLASTRTSMISSSATKQVGSAAYMSPQNLQGKIQVDDLGAWKKNDIYSYSIVLWELLTQKIPWEGITDLAHLSGRVCNDMMRPYFEPSRFTTQAELQLHDIACACWSPEPNDRPASFEVVVEDVRRLFTSVIKEDAIREINPTPFFEDDTRKRSTETDDRLCEDLETGIHYIRVAMTMQLLGSVMYRYFKYFCDVDIDQFIDLRLGHRAAQADDFIELVSQLRSVVRRLGQARSIDKPLFGKLKAGFELAFRNKTKDEMQQLLFKGTFFEHFEFTNNISGTPKRALEKQIKGAKNNKAAAKKLTMELFARLEWKRHEVLDLTGKGLLFRCKDSPDAPVRISLQEALCESYVREVHIKIDIYAIFKKVYLSITSVLKFKTEVESTETWRTEGLVEQIQELRTGTDEKPPNFMKASKRCTSLARMKARMKQLMAFGKKPHTLLDLFSSPAAKLAQVAAFFETLHEMQADVGLAATLLADADNRSVLISSIVSQCREIEIAERGILSEDLRKSLTALESAVAEEEWKDWEEVEEIRMLILKTCQELTAQWLEDHEIDLEALAAELMAA
eukprot:TRINITY_DN3122_c0_g1_i17.p1 TRINITY_DN3122_c0_g1~~TRINITY_DN3122_c0_g1_i17.p1  ORF type:complete len:977 (+),score=235.40 TRINITY_DN3122_c0_g1_i17:28-2931(+)